MEVRYIPRKSKSILSLILLLLLLYCHDLCCYEVTSAPCRNAPYPFKINTCKPYWVTPCVPFLDENPISCISCILMWFYAFFIMELWSLAYHTCHAENIWDLNFLNLEKSYSSTNVSPMQLRFCCVWAQQDLTNKSLENIREPIVAILTLDMADSKGKIWESWKVFLLNRTGCVV